MKKTDKKIESRLIKALKQVCETAQQQVPGFVWLTHRVNYKAFPDSLRVICVFTTQAELDKAIKNHQQQFLTSLIQEKLIAIDIRITSTAKQIAFDSEEACEIEAQGNWEQRLKI